MSEEKPDLNMCMAIAAQMLAVLFYRVSEQDEEVVEVLGSMEEYLLPLEEEGSLVFHIMLSVMEHASDVSLHMAMSEINTKTGGIINTKDGGLPGISESKEDLLRLIYPQFSIVKAGEEVSDGSEEEEEQDTVKR